jgi:FkbM family methyltransferase
MIKQFLKDAYSYLMYASFRKNYLLTKTKRKVRSIQRYQPGVANLNGLTLHYVDSITLVYGYEEIFEKDIYRFNPKSENILILDCGANIGLATVYFKMNYPKAKVISFEPDPKIYATLNKNIQSLELTDVETFQEAIWINNDGIEFNLEGGFSGRIPMDEEENKRIKVKSKRLKDLLNQKVDLLKMDIEGAENSVVFDIQDSLHNVENIFIEYHSHHNEAQMLGEILNILKNKGYRYHIQTVYGVEKPFVERSLMVGMELQLNIFGYRN